MFCACPIRAQVTATVLYPAKSGRVGLFTAREPFAFVPAVSGPGPCPGRPFGPSEVPHCGRPGRRLRRIQLFLFQVSRLSTTKASSLRGAAGPEVAPGSVLGGPSGASRATSARAREIKAAHHSTRAQPFPASRACRLRWLRSGPAPVSSSSSRRCCSLSVRRSVCMSACPGRTVSAAWGRRPASVGLRRSCSRTGSCRVRARRSGGSLRVAR